MIAEQIKSNKLRTFLPHIPQSKNLVKICSINFQPWCCFNFIPHTKNDGSSMHQFVIKLLKIFGIWLITVKFKSLYCCLSMKKIRNFHALISHDFALGPFRTTFWPKNFKITGVNIKPSCQCTLMQKIKNILWINFL